MSTILGIESSCDETAAAVLREDGQVLSDVVASQIHTHAPYGGVVPELASRAHLRAIVPVIHRALEPVEGGLDAIDAVAVTQGPGLVGALLVGLQAAKGIAWSRGLPLVGVNHLDGHLLSVFLRRDGQTESAPPFPYIALLASGGHTALYEVAGPHDIELLGQTRDDAAGEAYDKVAKVLGLGYPGGPIIDRLAAQGDPEAFAFPAPMLTRPSLEFSFAGLKTAVAQQVGHLEKDPGTWDEQRQADLCASFQKAVVEVLARKAVTACRQRGVEHVVLTGGVAANKGLRRRAAELCETEGLALHVPPMASCTDNAAMIAYAGAQRFASGVREGVDLRPYSRDPARRRGRFDRDGRLIPRR
jgi:N6-L-threonylcarbamoyladenine synthase